MYLLPIYVIIMFTTNKLYYKTFYAITVLGTQPTKKTSQGKN